MSQSEGLAIVVTRDELQSVIRAEAERLDALAKKKRAKGDALLAAEKQMAAAYQCKAVENAHMQAMGIIGNCGGRDSKSYFADAKIAEASANSYRYQADHLAPGETFKFTGHEMIDFMGHACQVPGRHSRAMLSCGRSPMLDEDDE